MTSSLKFKITEYLLALFASLFRRRFTFARIHISYARIFIYECAENLPSFARFNCAFLLILQVTSGAVLRLRGSIGISYARIFIYECAENLLSFARFNCAFL